MALTETYHGRKPEAALPYLLGSVGRSAGLEDQPDDGQGGPNTGPEGSSIGLLGKTSKLSYKIALAFETCRSRVSLLVHSTGVNVVSPAPSDHSEANQSQKISVMVEF